MMTNTTVDANNLPTNETSKKIELHASQVIRRTKWGQQSKRSRGKAA